MTPPQTSMRTSVITTETLAEVGFEGKRAEVIQVLSNGSQLSRTDLQGRLEKSSGLSPVLKDLAMQGILVETIHYDSDGKREARFMLNRKKLCRSLDLRADKLRQTSIEIEKACGGFSEEPDPPRTPPVPPVAPLPHRPPAPVKPPEPVERTPTPPPVPNGGVKLPSPFRQRS